MAQNLVEQLKTKILQFQPDVKVEKVGTVLEVGDGVARVSGLTQAASMEMLDFGARGEGPLAAWRAIRSRRCRSVERAVDFVCHPRRAS